MRDVRHNAGVAIVAIMVAWIFVPTLGCAPRGGLDDIKAAVAANRKGDTNEAIRLYTKAIESEELSTKAQNFAFYYRGDAWYAKQDYDHAIADYTEVIRLSPEFPSGFGQRGNAWFSKQDYDHAIADYTEAIRLSAQYGADAAKYAVPSLVRRGAAWHAKHDYDRAIADYTEAIRLSPQFGADAAETAMAGLGRRGDAWREKTDYDRAFADYNEVLRLDPQNVTALARRASLQFKLGRYPTAVGDWLTLSKVKADGYTYLWLYLSRARAGNADAKVELAAQSKLLKSDWPQPVIGLYLGELSRDEVLARALNGDSQTQKKQVCEANFYIGEWYLLEGDKGAADPLFRKARDDCPKGFTEADAASDELDSIRLILTPNEPIRSVR